MSDEPELLDAFRRTFLRDDLEGFMALISQDCVWTMMATGEAFVGVPQIREMAARSMRARRHEDGARMELVSTIVSRPFLVVEYVHHAIVTADWPASKNRPDVGTRLHIPICIVARTSDGLRFDLVREYFDLATASGHGGGRLYS